MKIESGYFELIFSEYEVHSYLCHVHTTQMHKCAFTILYINWEISVRDSYVFYSLYAKLFILVCHHEKFSAPNKAPLSHCNGGENIGQ